MEKRSFKHKTLHTQIVVRNLIFGITAILLLITCGRPGGGFDRGNQEKNPESVEVTPVQNGSISEQILSYGTLQSQEFVNVTPQVSNRITEYYVDLGDTVQRGQALAKIFDEVYEQQVQRDLAQVRQAQIAFRRDSSNYVRQVELNEKNLTSESEVETAFATYQSSKAQLASARASLAQSQENLENTMVRSPVVGVVAQRNLEPGDIATTGSALVQISSFVGLETRVFLPIQDWERVEPGQNVTLNISNAPSISAKAVVARKSPRLDEVTGLGEVVIALEGDIMDRYLGALCKVAINVRTKPQTITIPRASLVENVQTRIDPESNSIQLDRSYSVFVVEQDTIAVRKEIDLGIQQGNQVEVLSGLEQGDQLIITGQAGLGDSAYVKVASSSFLQPEQRQTISTEEAEGDDADRNEN